MRSLRSVCREDLARLERALTYARGRMIAATKQPFNIWSSLYMGVLAITRKYAREFPEEIWRV